MKQAINDDAQVQALCERLGAWPAISASIAAGHSGVVTAGAWVVGYFSDGLAAVEASNPLEQAAIAARMSGLIGGPRGFRVERCQTPAVH
jgi:hypothetical protein